MLAATGEITDLLRSSPKALSSAVTENVYLVRIETEEARNTYHFLVGIECGLHQLSKHDTAQQFAQSAFLAKHTPGRQITIYLPDPYEQDSLPSLPKVNQGCDCWTMEVEGAGDNATGA